jgi:hypothetical protein
MADLTYKFTGVNTAQLAKEVQRLRQNSSTFRTLEAAAAAAGYTTIEIQMGAGLLKKDIADSERIDSTTRRIRINSDATGSWGVGGRQATVGEMISHEIAHAVVPQELKEPGRYDFSESGTQGMWVRRLCSVTPMRPATATCSIFWQASSPGIRRSPSRRSKLPAVSRSDAWAGESSANRQRPHMAPAHRPRRSLRLSMQITLTASSAGPLLSRASTPTSRRRRTTNRSKPISERSTRSSQARAISGMQWRCTTPANPAGASAFYLAPSGKSPAYLHHRKIF